MKYLRGILIGIISLLISFIAINDYFHAGFPYTHDGENHLARFANYKIALKEGQFPPRFAPNLMNHYGYPVFNYNYPLANILSVPFSFVGLNYEVTFKVLVFAFVFMGVFGVGTWLKQLKFSMGSVVMGMGVYVLSPYLLSTIIYRGSIGEIMALGLLPWLMVIVEHIRHVPLQSTTIEWIRHSIVMIAITTAFLLSHNVSAMFGIPLMLCYAAWRFTVNWKIKWTRLLMVLGLAAALSLWFWLPAIAEKSLVILDNAGLSNQFAGHFPTLSQLLFAPLQFGYSVIGSIDLLSFQVGLVQLVLLLVTSLVVLKLFITKQVKNWRTALFFSLISVLVLFALQQQFTEFIWKTVPFVNFIQFPWRLGLFTTVLIAPVCAYAWQSLEKGGKLFVVFVLLAQLFVYLKARPADYFHRLNRDYDAFSQSTTTSNENTVRAFQYQEIGDWQPGPRLAKGTGEFIVNYWSGTRRQYRAYIWEPAVVVEPTMLFAGWETVVRSETNQSEVALPYYNDDSIKGRLAYQLQPGEYVISSQFTQKTWPRVIGNTVSGLAILFLAIIALQWLPRSWKLYGSWKILLLFVAALAPVFFPYHPHFPYSNILLTGSGLPRWLYSWANFDGVHYITIAEHGYKGTGLIQAFFPLYPGLLVAINFFVHNRVASGLLLTTIFGFLTLTTWKKLLAIDLNNRASWIGVLVLFLFPTAFFFQALYTESLFLFLVFAAFYNARQRKWWWAGTFAALASATRIVGVLLVPALLLELWLQQKEEGRVTKAKELLPIFLGLLGLTLYMIYLQVVFHDALYFMHVQSAFGTGRQQTFIVYPQVVWRSIKILLTSRPFDLNYFTYVQEFVMGTLGFLGIIWSWFKVRKSYVLFSALAFLVPTTTGTFSSIPRYILASFSVFIVITMLVKEHPKLQWLYFTISTLLLLFNTILFIQGYWIA